MRKSIGFWVLSSMFLATLCGPAAAAAEAEEATTLMERFDSETNRIMMQYKNALWRLEMDFKGIDTEREAAGETSTPFRACCGRNMAKIEASLVKLEGIFGELTACYEQNGNAAEKADLAIVKDDLAKFIKIIKQIEEIGSRDKAKIMGASGTRAFNDFMKSVETLDDCP